MLGKLMKYDLRSGIRTFGLIWIGLAALAAINGLTLRIAFDGRIQNTLVNFVVTVLPMILLVVLYVAMGIFMLVFIINRFYKGLLGDEGYLMFTLPVTSAAHIASKTLTSMIFELASAFVALLSGAILIALQSPLASGDIVQAFRDISRYLGIHPLPAGTGWVAAEFAVYSLIGMAVTILQIYTAISLGHLAKKNRGWFALLAYVGISIAVSILMKGCTLMLFRVGSLTDIIFGLETFADGTGLRARDVAMAASALGIGIGLEILKGTGFFFATRAILDKRLNLE